MEWIPTIAAASGPLYRQIADAIEKDVLAGRLRRGQQLPTHRALATELSIDLTTVTRAYTEARRRGLIDARVGQGTFVSESTQRLSSDVKAVLNVDLSMNVPPQPVEAALDARIARGLSAVDEAAGLSTFLTYQRPGGGDEERNLATVWLRPRLPEISADRLLIFPGSQSAIFSLLMSLCRPGDRVLTEALTFPGFKAAARKLRLEIIGVPLDDEGVVPDALAKAIKLHKPKVVYLTPTMHNPTTATMGETRRTVIARILRQAKIPLIEDDAYGALDPSQTLLATLIPQQTFLTVSLSKCLTPALRVSFLVAPDAQSIAILRDAVQAISQMASPLMTALVCQWLRSGEAKTIITAIRNEAAGRQQLAARILRGHPFASHPKGHHVWMPLPEGWSGAEFVGELFRRGLSVVASDAFAVDAASPSAIRLGLGAARSREDLASALYLLGATLRQWSGTRLVV